jgi:pSer/pThr/pTyr-binding forkhead associated (FHA) protein
VTINDKGASRRHAQIRHKDDSYVLTDLGSTNGTRLNGQTIQTRELSDGDRITIGSTLLEFREGSS